MTQLNPPPTHSQNGAGTKEQAEGLVSKEKNLNSYLQVLNQEQYLILFSIYGEEGISEYNKLESLNLPPEKVIKSLSNFINKDKNTTQKELILNKLASYYEEYHLDKDKLKELNTQAKEATKAKNDFNKLFQSVITTFTKELNDILPEDSKRLLADKQQRLDNEIAFQKREKIREKAIIAYLQGVRASVIDNVDEDYIATTNELAETTVRETKEVIKAVSQPKINDVLSSRGTDLILKATKPSSETKTRLQKGFAKNKPKK